MEYNKTDRRSFSPTHKKSLSCSLRNVLKLYHINKSEECFMAIDSLLRKFRSVPVSCQSLVAQPIGSQAFAEGSTNQILKQSFKHTLAPPPLHTHTLLFT